MSNYLKLNYIKIILILKLTFHKTFGGWSDKEIKTDNNKEVGQR